MSVFLQIASFTSVSGKFDETKDTQSINEKLQKLQDRGAKIIGVNVSLGGAESIVSAIYTITYEASAPIQI